MTERLVFVNNKDRLKIVLAERRYKSNNAKNIDFQEWFFG